MVAAERLVEPNRSKSPPGRRRSTPASASTARLRYTELCDRRWPQRESTSGVVTGRPAPAIASTIVRRCDV